MGSQLLSILRQGVWASLTGGWYYDQKQSHFSNLLHLYIWLLLLCLPLVIELCIKSFINEKDHLLIWSLYCFTIASIFAVIKVVNAYLHHLFDSGEYVIEEEIESPDSGKPKQEQDKDDGDKTSICYQSFEEAKKIYSAVDIHREESNRNSENQIEMTVLNSLHFETGENEDIRSRSPPSDSCRPGHDKSKEGHYSGDMPLSSGVIDLEVDFHHRNSSGSSIANWGSASSASGASGRLTVAATTSTPTASPQQQQQLHQREGMSSNHIELKEKRAKSIENDNESDDVKKAAKSDILPSELPLMETGISALSLSNDSSSELITTTQSTSSTALLKGASLSELGFMAQDPSVLRNISGCAGNESQLRTFKPQSRTESGFSGRRARSELETTNYSSGEKKGAQGTASSIPPSHPVSLEVIGSSNCDQTGDLPNIEANKLHSGSKSCRFSSVEVLNHTRPGAILGKTKSASVISDSIKPIHELSSDETGSQPREDGSHQLLLLLAKSRTAEEDVKQEPYSKSIPKVPQNSPDPAASTTARDQQESCRKNRPRKVGPMIAKAQRAHRKADNFSLRTSLEPKRGSRLDSFDDPVNEESSSTCSSDDGSWLSKSPSNSLTSSQTDSVSDNERTPLTADLVESKSQFDRNTSVKDRIQAGTTSPSSSSIVAVERSNDPRAFDLFANNENPKREQTSSAKSREPLQAKQQRPKTRRRNSGKSAKRVYNDMGSPGMDIYQPQGAEAQSTSGQMVPSSSSVKSEGPPAYLLARILATPGTHLAKSHDDTSMGAVHCFQDECGNWLTYIFDENSIGIARGLINSETKTYFDALPPNTKWNSESSESSESVTVMEGPSHPSYPPRLTIQEKCSNNTFSPPADPQYLRSPSINSMYTEPSAVPYPRSINHRFGMSPNILIGPDRHVSYSTNLNSPEYANIQFRLPMRFNEFTSPEPSPPKPRQYYKLWIPPCFRWKYAKIRFDRLNLITLLDRSLTKFELISSTLLAVLVAVLGSIVIEKGFFTDLWLFLFCFVICSSQYTLLKSVQPDAASPAHGYNRIIIYSRPVYFSIGCSIILLSSHYVENNYNWSFTLYDFNFLDPSVVKAIGESAKVFVLSFPIIFSFGLLPQINTFLMYLLEQIDIHVFGGTAFTIGLTSALYCIIRSILVVLFLYGIALTSLLRVTNRHPSTPLTYHDYDVLFSVFCGLLVFLAYFLSRQSSDPTVVYNLIRKSFFCDKKKSTKAIERSEERSQDGEEEDSETVEKEYNDPLPGKLEKTLLKRLENDVILSIVITIVFFAIHVSTIFTLQPYVQMSLGIFAVSWGFLLHYFFTHFRKELPWQFFASPILKPKEYDQYEVKGEANLMWFEKLQCWLGFIEKNVIYPLVFLSALTKDTPEIINKYGVCSGTLIMVICAFKSIRSTYTDSSHNHFIILFTFLLFEYDLSYLREPFVINYAVFSTVYHKFAELLLKIRFVVTYVAPWQISWGSAFHAFAQPFSVPHSGMLFVQAILSSILSSPLEPVLGSAIFLASYVRPIKFWERDYNTKRIDYSNTRLVNQLERSLIGSDDNNLNSIFYEHLTRSLQHSLYGDLALGRWGQVSQGDCFVLASDNLNCLVHIIELGNGLVTFQVRGLEFRGTYCQQREVEAISESVNDDEGCCCCEPGHLPSMLSVNAAFNQRWLAWEVTHSKYVLEGYSITDNSALSMLQPFELRKALITYYVKSLIYYTINSSKLETWLRNEDIRETIDNLTKYRDFVDLDPIFNLSIDEDYDFRTSGITRASFCQVYFNWISFCLAKRKNPIDESQDKEAVVSLCFALALLARRALSAASHNNSFNSVEFLLYGLHSLFKGDFRITSPRDEWVFKDIDLLKKIIAPSVRMAVKLHQDHFMSTDEYDDNAVLYASITNYRKNWVISHEADPVWRNALLSNVPSLLALRHVYEDGTNQYKIIMLNIRHLSFRVIKVNRECVRGLWAGQQQELVYLRNRNTERGSIQNAKQALRNIINSSCDQPIGYPIYVSPLITSFAETNPQYCSVVGRPLSLLTFKGAILSFWNRLKIRCREGCSSGRALHDEIDLDDMNMRSLNSLCACRRPPLQEHFSIDRNRGARCSRGSHGSGDRSFGEYESCHPLTRASRTIPSQAYPQTSGPLGTSIRENLSKSGRRQSQSSTLVNITAFRPPESTDNLEMTSFTARGSSYDQPQPIYQNVTLSAGGSSSASSNLHHRSRPELV